MAETLKLKIVIVGEANIGKSSLLLKYVDDDFREGLVTINEDFKQKTIKIDGREVLLHICDTVGQEKFRAVTSSYYRGTHGVIVAYDISKKDTINNVKVWLDEVEKKNTDDFAKILCGTKVDLKREVEYEEGKQVAAELNITHFYETSSKTSYNVKEMFECLAREMLKIKAPNMGPSDTTNIVINTGKKKKKKCF